MDEIGQWTDLERKGRRLKRFRSAIGWALEPDGAFVPRQVVENGSGVDPVAERSDGVTEREETGFWTDARLIAAVRREPPNPAALEALVDRY